MPSKRDGSDDDFFDQWCQNIHRFTNQHISSMLHSLIGLPSMLTPPSGQTWVIIDNDSRTADSEWKKEGAYNDGDNKLQGKKMEEIKKLKANWMSKRDGNAGPSGDSDRDKSVEKTDNGGSSSNSSGSPTDGRAVYVFRFPPSPFPRGFSDIHSPDTYQQVMKLHDHMLHSYLSDFYYPFSPFSSLFDFSHPFMFSPFWGLPRYYRRGISAPWEDDMESMDPFAPFEELRRRMREEERRWLREAQRVRNAREGQSKIVGVNEANSDVAGEQPHNSLPELSQRIQEITDSQPATELDAYEQFDSLHSSTSDNKATAQAQDTRHIIGRSTSTQTRRLYDGSTFTKTVKIIRYSDGTEERIEDEHSTAPTASRREIQGNAFEQGPNPSQVFSDFDKEGTAEDLRSAFLREKKSEKRRNEQGSGYSGEIFDMLKKPKQEVYTDKSPSESPPAQSKSNEERSSGGWGWFWR
ncbi:hypothetical protein BDZ91DRAFT_788530 [Kalaharituber pfeilii]|nr:hypothetical protein BDZ91DRAFT_788530 [Kalaharituber pfeilii]